MLRKQVTRNFGALLIIFAMAGSVAPVKAAPNSDDVRLHVQYSKAAGTTIAYAELGAGSPLLMLNGTGSPMNEWDPALLAELQLSHRVIVFDYPGLGLSGPAPAQWTFPHAADWIAQFAATVAPGESIDVLGWSMGGFIAQQFAVRHPDQVGSLVLAATNPGGPQTQLGPKWVQRLDSASDVSEQAYLKTNYPQVPLAQAAGRAFLSRIERAIQSGAYPVERVPNATYEAMVDAEDAWLRSSANLHALGSLSLSVLVMTGETDVVTPASNSRLMAKTIPHAQLVLVPRAGHSFVFQSPVRAARTIDKFLTGAD